METDLLTLVEQDGFWAARRSTSRGGQYNGPCPFPDCGGGTDRFRVQPNQGRYGWFACNQCGRKGSAVDYLMLKRGMSKLEALAMVGWMPKDGRSPHDALPRSAYDERPQWSEPPKHWQEAARDFYQTCQHVLWSPRGAKALDYLRKRGLSDKIIKGALLGYHPTASYGMAKAWGKPVRLPQGIVIPWFFAGSLWRITIRDESVAEGAGRYRQIAGGSNGLYLADTLVKPKLKRPTAVLVEGEFDALSVFQQCRDLVSVVATGTTQGSHTPRWVSLLAQQERVLIAFDAEGKGDDAAKWWLARLEHAQRHRPWWKDANQMLQEGVELRDWVTTGFEGASFQPRETSAVSTPIEQEREHLACCVCGAPIEDETRQFHFDEHGSLFCSEHWQATQAMQTPVEPSVAFTYEQFMRSVHQLASTIPDGCTITALPSGYTLAQHVHTLQAQEQAGYEAMMHARRKRWMVSV